MNMLTNEDLNAIGSLIDKKFDEKFDDKLPKLLEKQTGDIVVMVGTMLEQNIIPLFDGLDKRVDGIDKQLDGIDKRLDGHDEHFRKLLTKDDFDRSMAGFEVRLTEKFDRRYVRLEKPAVS